MKGKRFTEEQIISILKEHEIGAKVQYLVRKHSVSEQSIYRWQAKYSGMEVSEAKRLWELEQGNTRLKKLLAEAELDKAMLKDIVSKNMINFSQSKWVPYGTKSKRVSGNENDNLP